MPPPTKIEVITLLLKAWEEVTTIIIDNILLGFIRSGIFPYDFTFMMKRMNIYQGGGLSNNFEGPREWIKFREILSKEVLNVPPSSHKTRKIRKAVV